MKTWPQSDPDIMWRRPQNVASLIAVLYIASSITLFDWYIKMKHTVRFYGLDTGLSLLVDKSGR